MNWIVKFLPEAKKDFLKLSGNQQLQVRKAIRKIQTNPLPVNQGGYGKPLGNKGGNDLTNYLKVKLLNAGIRIVYELVYEENTMTIIVIGFRADSEVYKIASHRIRKYKS